MRTVRMSLIGAVFAAELLASTAMAAPPPCGRKACREEIRACVQSECSGLEGATRARCRRECVEAVQSACNENEAVCNPSVTTTTGATTSSAPSTSTTPTTSSTSSTTLVGSPSGGFVD